MLEYRLFSKTPVPFSDAPKFHLGSNDGKHAYGAIKIG